ARDGGDRGVGRVGQPREALLDPADERGTREPVEVLGRVRAEEVREHGGVEAGGERATGPGHDEGADRAVGTELRTDPAELEPHLVGLRVELLGPLELHVDDGAVALDGEGAHDSTSRIVSY